MRNLVKQNRHDRSCIQTRLRLTLFEMILLFTFAGLGLIFLFGGILYRTNKRAKLAYTDQLEFTTTIQPQIRKYEFLSNLPMLLFIIYVLFGMGGNVILFLSLSFSFFLLQIAAYFFSYIQIKKIIAASKRYEAFRFYLNFVIFMGLSRLFLMCAMALPILWLVELVR
jgi:hypothetical protein